MKKTLIALMAMSSAAFGDSSLLPESLLSNWSYDTIALYDFEGSDAATYLSNKSTSSNKTGGTWVKNAANLTQENGAITLSNAGGQYSGLYDANISLSGNWAISLQANPATHTEVANRGLMQFGTQFALYIGSGSAEWGNLGLAFSDDKRYTLSDNKYKTGLHTYTLTYIDSTLKLWVDGVDITSQLTLIGEGDSTVDSSFDTVVPNGSTSLYKLAYTNDLGPIGLASGSTLNELAAYKLTAKVPSPETPTIPEPTTATLSLLALAGLAARRRRR